MGFVRWFLAEPRRPRLGREDDWVPAPSHFRSVRGGTMSSNPPSSSGESTANLTSGASIDDRRGFTESVTLGLFLQAGSRSPLRRPERRQSLPKPTGGSAAGSSERNHIA